MQVHLTKFKLGQVVITRQALLVCETHGIDHLNLLLRHSQGDWGDLAACDKALNNEALRFGDRILSRYEVSGHSFYIVTEHDRSVTTIMRVEDY